jgi:hypothetical protein
LSMLDGQGLRIKLLLEEISIFSQFQLTWMEGRAVTQF